VILGDEKDPKIVEKPYPELMIEKEMLESRVKKLDARDFGTTVISSAAGVIETVLNGEHDIPLFGKLNATGFHASQTQMLNTTSYKRALTGLDGSLISNIPPSVRLATGFCAELFTKCLQNHNKGKGPAAAGPAATPDKLWADSDRAARIENCQRISDSQT
jgi:hypothetical protein